MSHLKPLFFAGFWLLLSIVSASLQAANQEIPFRRISPVGGFTLSPVIKIDQDHHGFIWFVTREKLYQYNTQDFVSFSPQYQAGISHTNNYINSLLIDRANTIWLGTNAGLSVFNEHTWQLEPVDLADADTPGRILNIADIKQNCKGEIWVQEGASLAQLDTARMVLNYLKEEHSRLNVNSFCFDTSGNIYAVNNSGEIYRIDHQTRAIKKIAADLSLQKIHGIFLVHNTLWITSDGYGLCRYTTDGKQIDSYFSKKENAAATFSNRIRGVLQTSDGKTWVATYKGLMEWKEGTFQRYLSEFDNPFSLPDNSIVTLFEDNQKGLWIGTWRGGVAYLNTLSNTFETYQHSPYENSLCGNVVNTIAEDLNHSIWIGTDGHGLDVFDERQKSFNHLTLTNDKHAAVTNIKCIYPDPNGDIWVGTFSEGIFVRRKGETNFNQAVLDNRNVYDLVSDGSGLWIATFGTGLFYYRYSDKSLTRFNNRSSDATSLPSNYVRKLLLDASQNLWIISNAGICVKMKNKNTFEPILRGKDLQSGAVQVYTVTAGTDGMIWLGTDQGIMSVDPSRKITRYPLLINDTPVSVYGIVVTSPQQMWISSNFGVFSYNPGTSNYLNYSVADGLPGNLFNAGALCHTSTGRIYFGGTSGMVAFHPGRMQVNPYVPRVYFSRMFINHKEILPMQENSPLKNPLYETDQLRLHPSQNSFSIEFVALNYLNPQKNQFRYRLKGFDQNWVEAGYNNKATYTNIPSGKYLFEVMACNNDMVWNQTPATLTIVIPRPVMLSNVALLIYLVLLVALGMGIRRIILYRSRLEHQIELERLKRMQEENAHQNKLMFFTNISHELRTPLTLIAGPVESLLKSPNLDQGQYNQLSVIKRNAGRLLKLINQLLEFRRIEENKTELHLVQTDLIAFVREIFNYFIDVARQKNINYVFVSPEEPIHLPFDPEKIDKAVFNLLSNAFKFTPAKGTILLEITTGQTGKQAAGHPNVTVLGELKEKGYVQLSVEDNGPGIEQAYIEKVFERFYRVENSETPHSGTGIGLHLTKHLILLHGGEIELESEVGKGSRFSIRLPYTGEPETETPLVVEKGTSLPHHPAHDVSLAEEAGESNAAFVENWNDPAKTARKNDKLVLVVEDHHDLSNFICYNLSDEYRVISAVNGLEGIEKAQLFLPDLIVSDVMMPGKSGIELVGELKNNLKTSHIPIILLTALTSVENKIEGFGSGADDYIEKPFNSEVLKARIKNIFANRLAIQQYYSGKIALGFEGEPADSPDQKMMAKAIRFVEKNMTDEKFDIEQLAAHLNLSQSTLYRKLKALTGKSSTDFIRSIRLEYAARLLKAGHDSIEEVSARSGFNSHSYFTRSFKEYFGKTPSEYIADQEDK